MTDDPIEDAKSGQRNGTPRASAPFRALLAARVDEAMRRTPELTHRDWAPLWGVSVASVSRVRTGRCVPGVETLAGIADALDVSLDWLTGRE